MRIALRLFGLEVGAVTIEPDETLLALSAVGDDSDDEGARLSTSDHSFGFTSDPAFPEFEWEEDE